MAILVLILSTTEKMLANLGVLSANEEKTRSRYKIVFYGLSQGLALFIITTLLYSSKAI